MKGQAVLIDFVLKEWLLVVSGAGLVLTSLAAGSIPVVSRQEIQVLFILFALFVAVNGLQHSGLIARLAQAIETGRAIPLKLVLTTFFLSMLVTNDVALVVVVPLTLLLNVGRKDLLIILEALAANAGSALTPFGNPQNLFIYWFYGVPPLRFVETIAPFSLLFLPILLVPALLLKTAVVSRVPGEAVTVSRKAGIYLILLVAVILAVLRVLPLPVGVAVIGYALVFDRRALRVDYFLLCSFLFFFGLADNIKLLVESRMNHTGHIFLLSALASQAISNVPATLLFAKFTTDWQALLWGASVGGFGSLFGSLANLIAYKLYARHESSRRVGAFTLRFLVLGYLAFFVAIGLYFVLDGLAFL